jgi:hypothetical protein
MKTISHTFRVDRRDINYLRVTLESYDGMAVVKTVDPDAALIQIQMAPGCETLVFELLGSLAQDEGLDLVRVADISKT